MTTPTLPLTPACDMPADDLFMSMTGYDELAIREKFGADPGDLKDRPMIFLRALAFVALRRRGMKPAEAYDAVMRAPFVAVNDFFPDLEPELTPDDPDTDQGKDG